MPESNTRQLTLLLLLPTFIPEKYDRKLIEQEVPKVRFGSTLLLTRETPPPRGGSKAEGLSVLPEVWVPCEVLDNSWELLSDGQESKVLGP